MDIVSQATGAMVGGMKIQSDFTDYYDGLAQSTGYVTYNRFYKNSESRATSLARLRAMGVQTVSLKAISDYNIFSGFEKYVVYTNQYEHNFRGKEILTLQDALEMFPNCAAVPFYEESNGITLKMLQIGSRRFRLMLKNTNLSLLREGSLIDIQEIKSSISYSVGLPLYSIDYIQTREGLLAIDFNYVQRLDTLGIQHYLTAEETYSEIRDALINLANFVEKRGN